jgi:hypothetical protein
MSSGEQWQKHKKINGAREAFFSTLSWQEKRTEVAKNAETFFFFFLSFFLFFTTRP